MIFYLWISTVVLTAIFGLLHSQTARETLHLQPFYDWSIEILKNYFPIHNLFNEERVFSDTELIEVIDTNEANFSNLMKTQSIDSIEEICDFKLGDEDSIGSRSNESLSSNRRKDNSAERLLAGHEEVFEAIHASLKKLSATANSVKMNGNQLYNLFLQEIVLQHKGSASRNIVESETTSIQSPNAEAVIDVKEVEVGAKEKSEKPKMYFGGSPLEYVPHQK